MNPETSVTKLKAVKNAAKKLNELWPPFGRRVAAVLETLERLGWQPIIATGWRSPAQQLKEYREGDSKLKWGLHCATGKNGKPESLAADIVDARYLWGGPTAFWLDLYRVARAQGLVSGAEWGLNGAQRATLKTKAAEAARSNGEMRVRVGWDPAHVQAVSTKVPAALVRAGWRPRL